MKGLTADVTFLAPSPGGFKGGRGWYVVLFRVPVAGPFASESEAVADARSRGFYV